LGDLGDLHSTWRTTISYISGPSHRVDARFFTPLESAQMMRKLIALSAVLATVVAISSDVEAARCCRQKRSRKCCHQRQCCNYVAPCGVCNAPVAAPATEAAPAAEAAPAPPAEAK
jgi:hypothetical protein